MLSRPSTDRPKDWCQHNQCTVTGGVCGVHGTARGMLDESSERLGHNNATRFTACWCCQQMWTRQCAQIPAATLVPVSTLSSARVSSICCDNSGKSPARPTFCVRRRAAMRVGTPRCAARGSKHPLQCRSLRIWQRRQSVSKWDFQTCRNAASWGRTWKTGASWGGIQHNWVSAFRFKNRPWFKFCLVPMFVWQENSKMSAAFLILSKRMQIQNVLFNVIWWVWIGQQPLHWCQWWFILSASI
jgi:hypothetical protein